MKKPALSLLLSIALTSVWSVEAGAAEPLVDKLETCAQTQDTLQRLACFDREFAPFRPRRAAVPAVAAAPATPPMPAPVAPAPPSFGEEKLRAKVKPDVQEEEQVLHARIASLREVSPDSYLVTLDNGQVWRHEDQRLGAFLREGEAITIRKAAFGTYRLTRDGVEQKAWIRATRVR
jgi:hypothetical protein